MNKKITKRIRTCCLLFVFILVYGKNYSQPQTIVHADPALSSFDITDLVNNPANANTLLDGVMYLLKLSFQNLSVNAIPPGTAYIKIGLGLHMVIDPAYDLSTAPYSEYFTWSYDVSQSQPQIIGIIHNSLPAFFDGQAVFRVTAYTTGLSSVSGNFLLSNPPGNPYRLVDDNPNNNSAFIDYAVSAGGPTPVTITKFNAVKKDCIIMADWSVENEINFDHYELQVSKDGINYSSVNTINAQNNTNYNSSFDISNQPTQLQGNNLYLRLKMVDKDGSFKYSNIVPVSGKCDMPPAFVIYGYPNPVIDRNNITIALKEGLFNGKYNITLVDMNGKIYGMKELELNNVRSFRFDFGIMLANGKYMIRFQQRDGGQKGILQFEKL